MAIQLELLAEVEEQLQEKAASAGLSLEGYLLTLIDAVLQPPVYSPPRSALSRSLLSFGSKRPATEPVTSLDTDVRQAIRQMRENVLSYKEQAVAAVSKMNLLRTALTEQQRIMVETELQALSILQQGKRLRAKQLFLEKMVLEKHLERVLADLTAATEAAEAVTQVFQKEEKRVQERASEVQRVAYKAYQQAMLRPEQIEKLTKRFSQEADWDNAFEQWVEQKLHPESSRLTKDDLMACQREVDVEAVHQAARQWAKEANSPFVPEATDEGERA